MVPFLGAGSTPADTPPCWRLPRDPEKRSANLAPVAQEAPQKQRFVKQRVETRENAKKQCATPKEKTRKCTKCPVHACVRLRHGTPRQNTKIQQQTWKTLEHLFSHSFRNRKSKRASTWGILANRVPFTENLKDSSQN